MKKLIFTVATFFFTLFSTDSIAHTIFSYQQLSNLIQQGGVQFTIVANFSQCADQVGLPTRYFMPKYFAIIPATSSSSGFIATSDLHFAHFSESLIYEYVRYTFKPDNSVSITTTDYNPHTFAIIGKRERSSCSLNKGVLVSY